jgi:hypothetical protein
MNVAAHPFLDVPMVVAEHWSWRLYAPVQRSS